MTEKTIHFCRKCQDKWVFQFSRGTPFQITCNKAVPMKNDIICEFPSNNRDIEDGQNGWHEVLNEFKTDNSLRISYKEEFSPPIECPFYLEHMLSQEI